MITKPSKKGSLLRKARNVSDLLHQAPGLKWGMRRIGRDERADDSRSSMIRDGGEGGGGGVHDETSPDHLALQL